MSNSKFYRDKLDYSVSDPSVEDYRRYVLNRTFSKVPVNYALVRERATVAFSTTHHLWKNSSVILSDHIKSRELTVISRYEGNTNDQHPRTLYIYKMNEAWSAYQSSDMSVFSLTTAIKYILSVAFIDMPSHVDSLNSYFKHFIQMTRFVSIPYYMAKLIGFRQSVVSSFRAYRGRFGISVVHDEVKRLPADLFSTHFVTCVSFSSPSRAERMFVGSTGNIILSIDCVPVEHRILMKSSFIPKMHLVNYVTIAPIASSVSAYDTFNSILNCDVSTRVGYHYGRELTMVNQTSPPTLMFGEESMYLGELGEFVDMFPDNDYCDWLYEFLLQFNGESVAFMIKLLGLADSINLVDGKFFPEYNASIDHAVYLVWSGLFYDLVLHYHGIRTQNLRVDSRPSTTVFPHMSFNHYNRLITLPARVSAYDRYCATDNGVFQLGYVIRDLLFGLSLRYAQGEIEIYGDSSTQDCLETATIVFANGHMIQAQVLLNTVTSIKIEKEKATFEFFEDVHVMVYPYLQHHGYISNTAIVSYINRLRAGVDWVSIFNTVRRASLSSLTSIVPTYVIDQVNERLGKYVLARTTLGEIIYAPEYAVIGSVKPTSVDDLEMQVSVSSANYDVDPNLPIVTPMKPIQAADRTMYVSTQSTIDCCVCDDLKSSGLHDVSSDLNGANGSYTGTDDHNMGDLFSRAVRAQNDISDLDRLVNEFSRMPINNVEIVEYGEVPHVVYNSMSNEEEDNGEIGSDSDDDDFQRSFSDGENSEGDFYGANGETSQELVDVLIQYFTPDQDGQLCDQFEINLLNYSYDFQVFLDTIEDLFRDLLLPQDQYVSAGVLLAVRDCLDDNGVDLNTRQLSFVFCLLNKLSTGYRVGSVELSADEVWDMWAKSEEISQALFHQFKTDLYNVESNTDG
jgi:hypothetical protein